MKKWFSSNCVLKEALSKITLLLKWGRSWRCLVKESGKSTALAPSKAPHAQLECLEVSGGAGTHNRAVEPGCDGNRTQPAKKGEVNTPVF